MKKTLLASLLALGMMGTANANTISLNNMGFESGLSGWIGTGQLATGTTTIAGFNVNPNSGNNFGYILNNGIFLQLNTTIGAGDTLRFAYRFLTGENIQGNTPFNDQALVVSDTARVIATVNTATANDSGWKVFTYTSPVFYSGPITFTLANIGDQAVPSALALDAAVPLPAAAWLFGSALFGAGALRRKQKTELVA